MTPNSIVITDGKIAQMTHSQWEAIKRRIDDLESALGDAVAYIDDPATSEKNGITATLVALAGRQVLERK